MRGKLVLLFLTFVVLVIAVFLASAVGIALPSLLCWLELVCWA